MSSGGANFFSSCLLPVFECALYIVERHWGSFSQKKCSLTLSLLLHVWKSQKSDNLFFHLTGLGHLCEFIEDCEHTVLATRILHLLGREGPRSQNPSKYIRFIYNRVILENAAVRAGKNVVLRLFLYKETRSNIVSFKALFGFSRKFSLHGELGDEANNAFKGDYAYRSTFWHYFFWFCKSLG